jgi:hypothetical protein
MYKEDTDFQDGVCKEVIENLDDYDWDLIECGIPEVLCNQILIHSGIVDGETINQLIRNSKAEVENDIEQQMISFIQYIYPQYTDKYFDDLTNLDLINIYARALYVHQFNEEERTIHNFNKVFEINQANQPKQKQFDPRTVMPKQGLGSNIYGAGM